MDDYDKGKIISAIMNSDVIGTHENIKLVEKFLELLKQKQSVISMPCDKEHYPQPVYVYPPFPTHEPFGSPLLPIITCINRP